jgi:hypothetical protein
MSSTEIKRSKDTEIDLKVQISKDKNYKVSFCNRFGEVLSYAEDEDVIAALRRAGVRWKEKMRI